MPSRNMWGKWKKSRSDKNGNSYLRKNNYGDDEDEDEDDGNPYDDEAVWIREFCEEDDDTDYELGYVGTQI